MDNHNYENTPRHGELDEGIVCWASILQGDTILLI